MLRLLIFGGVSCLSAGAARGAESSGNASAILHLDAARQTELRRSAGLPPTANGAPLDRWLDASAGARHAVQSRAAGRPVLRTDGAEAFVRFDGQEDCLVISGSGAPARDLTIFILAAPRSNPGAFSGLFASARAGQNDYTSGINLDLGPGASKELSVLNAESAGAGGFRNFLQPGRNLAAGLPFEHFHVFTLRSSVGPKGNELFLDGVRLGDRPRAESTIGLDDLVIGGRFYSNDPGEPPHAQGTFHGDIAAVQAYDRALSDPERQKIEQALFARTPALNALASGHRGHALQTVPDAPLLQMLVPGFTAEELPIALRNQTGLRYRHDGRLVALGYDGRIHLVHDSDGDGREDKATVFWDKSTLRGPIGMALSPKDDPRGDGVLVASKGKVSLFLDKDRDGVADEEIIVASGWSEIAQNVDAVGLAVDPRDGGIFFGLGTENYANAYLLDPATGQSRFRITTEHGTIQRVSPDFSTRETFCTGVRFTCALAFNRHGDLFASDQEGATWLANGNPLDELLHLQSGRHYGFPPRHPKHLPQVIDEPAVMEYGPQHQSTVGMIFNEGVNGGPAFGPAAWSGDALLCGESRGKLYRTQLVKTAAGYIARNQLLACLGMLIVDACVTPRGDLLIACHSGPPDWGTGPAGAGKIFRIRYTGRDTPQPVHTWAAAPDEFRIAFDRTLTPSDWAGARAKIRIEAGRHVSAGDRFEIIRPGYQVVRDQMTAPRRWVDVQSLSLSADRRTLVLRVPRQTEAVPYAITLPTPASWRTESAIPQKPEIDLALTLHGLQATLESGGSGSRIVLPHPAASVSKELTSGSSDHAAFFRQLEQTTAEPFSLTLRGGVEIANLFVPAIQPGATLDWDIGADSFANRTMAVRQDFTATAAPELTLKPEGKSTIAPVQFAVRGPIKSNSAGWVFALDGQIRPIPLPRLFLPWASRAAEAPASDEPAMRADVRGRWLHGRRVFFSDGGCVTCHTIRGQGTAFGPDLSNLVFRDRDSVFHDLTQPSATLNPDMTGSRVRFKDGTEVNGIVRTLTDAKIVVHLPANAHLERRRDEVASIEPMSISLMPETITQNMTSQQMEDLLTFLLTNPLEPARITRLDPAPPRTRTQDEMAPFMSAAGLAPEAAAGNPPPLRVLLCIDDKDHGLDEHDYPLWQQRWANLLSLADAVTVATAKGFPSREQLGAADVTVFFSRNAGWNSQAAALLDEYQERGGGLVFLHWAMEGGREAPALAERIGLATGGSKFRHGAMELNFTRSDHPITQGFSNLKLIDETYWAFHGDEKRIVSLATAVEEQGPRTQLWTLERKKGRVFGCIPGHYTWTFDDPLYRVLVLRGVAWAARLPDVNRLVELATVGARVAP